MYQFQTHSHRSRLQWISSLKKAIDNSGEEVNFDKYSCLYVTTTSFHQQSERYQQRQALQRRGLREAELARRLSHTDVVEQTRFLFLLFCSLCFDWFIRSTKYCIPTLSVTRITIGHYKITNTTQCKLFLYCPKQQLNRNYVHMIERIHVLKKCSLKSDQGRAGAGEGGQGGGRGPRGSPHRAEGA